MYIYHLYKEFRNSPFSKLCKVIPKKSENCRVEQKERKIKITKHYFIKRRHTLFFPNTKYRDIKEEFSRFINP